MFKLIKNLIFISCLISTLAYASLHAQTMAAPSYPTIYQELHSIKEWLEVDTVEANQNIVDRVFINLHENTEDAVLKELAKDLTTDELKKLYNILIKAIDHEWTEAFAEKLWQALSLKIKLWSPVLHSNPRIILIAVTPGERQFVMMLSDGSTWEVADHLSGEDSSVDLIIIRGLLGQYTEVEIGEYDNYSYRIATLGFPEIRFNGYMLANKTFSLISENKQLYWLGELYNAK